MSIELTLLLWSVVLHLTYLITQSTLYRMEFGVEFANTARDGERPPSGLNARGEKALRNFMETYLVFVVLALVTHITGRSDALTYWGAIVWFAARIAYLPLYIIGVPNIRSLAWFISLLGLAAMFFGVLL